MDAQDIQQDHSLFCINPRIHPIASGSAVKIPADRSPTTHRDVTIRPPRSVLPYQAPNKKWPWDIQDGTLLHEKPAPAMIVCGFAEAQDYKLAVS